MELDGTTAVNEEDSANDNTTVTVVARAPAYTMRKTVNQASISAPGTLTYTFAFVNNGNVALNNLTVADDNIDSDSLTGCPIDTLAAGASASCTAKRTISQAQIDAGADLTNTATPSATGPDGAVIDEDDSANDNTTTTAVKQMPAYTMRKTVNQASISAPGTLTYNFEFNNTGNVTLTNLTVDDTNIDNGTLSGCPIDTLAAGASASCTAKRTISQAQIDAGADLTNTATPSATAPDGAVVAEDDSANDNSITTVVARAPAYTMTKTVDQASISSPGTLTYTFTFVNTGNVALTNLTVDDTNIDNGTLSGCPIATLAAGASASCTAKRTISQAQIDAGADLTNTATSSATTPDGTVVAEDDSANDNSVTTDVLQSPVATDDTQSNPGAPSPSNPTTLATVGANDKASDGILDPATVDLDPAAPGIQSTLTNADGTYVADSDGNVTFTPSETLAGNPTPIQYTINDNNGNTSNPATLTVTYGSAAMGEVIGLVYEDKNGNGTQDASEPGIPNVQIVITDSEGNTQTVTTDSDGTYGTTVPVGTTMLDIVESTLPAGRVQTEGTDTTTVDVPANGSVVDRDGFAPPQPKPPIATDDSVEDQALDQPVTIKTVANDSDPDGDLDPSSVRLQDSSGNTVTTLVMPGEGTWTVDTGSGDISFTPEPSFLSDPTPVKYTVKDSTGLESNVATVTVDYEELAAIEGTVWLDRDKDNEIDPGENRKAGWILKIKDKNGHVVATTVTDAQGNYSVTGLIPDSYTVEFFNPNGTLITSKSTDGPLTSGETMNLPLPVDPSGVVYGSTTREVLGGVTLQLVNAQGTPVDPSCLGEGQQNQVTTEDGLYTFYVYPSTHTSCQNGEIYRIKVISAPAGYYTDSALIAPQAGVYDSDANESNCTVDAIANSGSCEIQGQPDAPQGNQATTYYLDFILNAGDSNVIFNHIPLDPEKARDTEMADDTVLLSKAANKKQVSIGDQVYYTVHAENTSTDEIEVDVRDQLPKGFKFVSSVAKLTRAGADNTLNTADDSVTTIKANGTRPVHFGPLTLAGNETVQIAYILKVGTAVTPNSNAINTVQVFAAGNEDDIASNIATATVSVVTDSVLDQSALIGKVFHDRDGDGYQDPAHVTGLTVKSDYFGWNSLYLGDLDGRISVLDNPNDLGKYQKVIRMPYSQNNAFEVTTQQGTVLMVDHQGQITSAHTGQKQKGLTAQDIRITTRRTRGIPTPTPVKAQRVPARETDVLEITLTNYGIHEEGIPGVRIATVDGLLIETDGYGRYHLPDVDSGRRGWGKNIILKVDTATLPHGARFTTENPRVLRITGSALNKINFGVKLPVEQQQAPQKHATTQAAKTAPESAEGVPHQQKIVQVEMSKHFFVNGSAAIQREQMSNIKLLADKIKQYGQAQITIDMQGVPKQLGYERAQSVRQALYPLLGEQRMQAVKIMFK